MIIVLEFPNETMELDLSDEYYDALESLATKNECSVGEIIETAIREYCTND